MKKKKEKKGVNNRQTKIIQLSVSTVVIKFGVMLQLVMFQNLMLF